ncbi:MAG: biotin--[acetyl-CoA-carboxylase] ligase [Bacillota bacterium]
MQPLRERLMTRLLTAKGYLSGTEVSQDLGVSREAVWKHIRALRREGFVISASPRKGYLLLDVPDVLHPGVVLPSLTGAFGRPYHYHGVLSSTNDRAKELAHAGAVEGTVVAAEEQTGGRGRRGRLWHSPHGGLWFSLILRPTVALQNTLTLVERQPCDFRQSNSEKFPEAAKNKHSAESEAGRRGAYTEVREHRTASLTKLGAVLQQPPTVSPAEIHTLSLLVSLAVVQGVEELLGIRPDLKWPNDIILDGRKAGGVLVEISAEAEQVHYAVAGVGLNVNITFFPEELEAFATSLKIYTEKETCRARLLGVILKTLENSYFRWCREGFAPFLKDYKERLCCLEKEVVVDDAGRVFGGVVLDVEAGGRLVLGLPDGKTIHLSGGEVTVREGSGP